MIDLAERCVERMKQHVGRRLAEEAAKLPPSAREAFERMTFEESEDRVRYWAEVERELVDALRPVQELIDGASARIEKFKTASMAWRIAEDAENEIIRFVERKIGEIDVHGQVEHMNAISELVKEAEEP